MTYVSDATSATLGTYIKIDVPSHGTSSFYYLKDASSSSYTMSSYLRIGAVPDDDPTAEDGWDLAQLVVGFTDDTRTRVADLGETPSNALSGVLAGTIENATTTGTTTTTTTTTYAVGETPPTAGTSSITDSYGVTITTTIANVTNDDGTTTTTTTEVQTNAAYDSDTMSIPDTLQTLMTSFYGSGTKKLTTDQEKRVTESMKLHYRGGWRDHTDGNRITSTRGDKVEVIRGNYKMVVLGRRPDASSTVTSDCVSTPVDSIDNSTTTWDASGGHIHDWRQTPGATTEISWVKSPYSSAAGLPGENDVTDPGTSGDDDSGSQYYTWRVKEETVKGDVEETTYGKVSEWFLGPSMYTQEGWEGAPDGTSVPQLLKDNTRLSRENPTITEKTWAKSISEYTGSSACPVESITEKTHATDITNTTDVSGTITSTVNATGLEEILHVNNVVRHIGKDGSPAHVSETWCGNFGELFLGGYESLKVGLFLEGRIAGKILEVNVSLLGKNVVTWSAMQLLNLDYTFLKVDNQTAFHKLDFMNCVAATEMCTVKKQEVHLSRYTAALMCFLG